MRVQVLVATMNQEKGDYSLLERMNIQCDAIICNQCDYNDTTEFEWKGHNIKWYSFAERGVGLNRNNALMRADADICLFADDDVVYYDGYMNEIKEFYSKHLGAEMVLFNFKVKRGRDNFKDIIKETKKVKSGLTSFGTYSITIKTSAVRRNNIYFHLEFGGGAKYSAGEDSIFLNDCLKNNLNIYICNSTLGKVEHNDSTWFEGYTKKYFFDKGILFYELVGIIAPICVIFHAIKHSKNYKNYGIKNAITLILQGVRYRRKDYEKNRGM